MKVLISSGYLGGAGGAERALYSILKALEADDVDVVIRHRRPGHLASISSRTKVTTVRDLRWKGAARKRGPIGLIMQGLVNPIRRRFNPTYDVYLQFLSGMDISSAVRASLRLLVPSGNQLPETVVRSFDYIALQAPDNVKFVPPGARSVLLPPPVLPLHDEAVPPKVALPADYFLTVFNPYDPVKGLDDFAVALSSAPHPIVWCHSQKTLTFDIPLEFRKHPRVIHVDDPSPAELRYLYENTRAYLSFSKSEGFGWSIADALRYSRIIVSREVGVLSFPEAATSGLLLVNEPWGVVWHLIDEITGEPDAELEWLSREQFRERLSGIAR